MVRAWVGDLIENRGRPFEPDWTLAPGELVLEAADGFDDPAALLGMDDREYMMLLKGERAITEELAHRLACVFGRPPHYWLALEAEHRADVLRLYRDRMCM